jgi:hypothetical protein
VWSRLVAPHGGPYPQNTTALFPRSSADDLRSGCVAWVRAPPRPRRAGFSDGAFYGEIGLVGGPGFEPGASRSRTVRAAKLRQPPTRLLILSGTGHGLRVAPSHE